MHSIFIIHKWIELRSIIKLRETVAHDKCVNSGRVKQVQGKGSIQSIILHIGRLHIEVTLITTVLHILHTISSLHRVTRENQVLCNISESSTIDVITRIHNNVINHRGTSRSKLTITIDTRELITEDIRSNSGSLEHITVVLIQYH